MLFQNYCQLTLLYFQGMFYRVNHKYNAFTVGERERERERERNMIIRLIMCEALFGWWLRAYNRVCSVMEFMLDQLVTGAGRESTHARARENPTATWGFNHPKTPPSPHTPLRGKAVR